MVANKSVGRRRGRAALHRMSNAHMPRAQHVSLPGQPKWKIVMTEPDLSDIYRSYIACLNRQDWKNLPQFVHDDVYYNDKQIGSAGYRAMLGETFARFPTFISTSICWLPTRLMSGRGCALIAHRKEHFSVSKSMEEK